MSGPDHDQQHDAASEAAAAATDSQQQGRGQQEQEAVRAAKRAKVVAREAEAEDEEESLGDDEDGSEEEEDEELERPAVDAITLRLVGGDGAAVWDFRLEFTHQLFEGEEIPLGYPDLRVELTIDGRTGEWAVDIAYDEAAGREEKKAALALAAKQAAEEEDEEAEQEEEGEGEGEPTAPAPVVVLSSNDGDDIPLLKCLMPAVPPTEGAACTVNGRRGRLYAERGFVADGVAGGKEEEAVVAAVLPFGVEVGAYRVQDTEFVLLHALPSDVGVQQAQQQDGNQNQLPQEQQYQAVAKFHRRVQKLAPWFIENGDDVDPEAGEWELLYLVQKHKQQQDDSAAAAVTLAGYLTLYAFNNPLKGKGLRVCQALVIPPFQRQGHGQHLLRAAYTLARQRDIVFEVTVEDPCPGFAMLRAVTDTQDLRALCKADGTVLGDLLADGQRFDCLEKPQIAAVQSALKLTKNQVILAYETLKLRQAPEDGDAATHTKYRLMIKRRRAREVQGEYVGRKPEMQAHLEKFYRERLAECSEILRRAKLPALTTDGDGASE